MSPLSDPLTALNLALLASFAVGLLLTSGRRRLRVPATIDSQPRRDRRD